MFLKLGRYSNYLKPFLITLNYWPNDIGMINGKRVIDSDIGLDNGVIEILRDI
jgi:predicted Holliday junction resolvase-like endonuclease